MQYVKIGYNRWALEKAPGRRILKELWVMKAEK